MIIIYDLLKIKWKLCNGFNIIITFSTINTLTLMTNSYIHSIMLTILTVANLIRIWKINDSSSRVCLWFALFIFLKLVCFMTMHCQNAKKEIQKVGKTCNIISKVGKTYKIVAEVAMTDKNMWKVGRRRRYPEVGKTSIFDNDDGMADNFTIHVCMADGKKVPWRMSAALGGGPFYSHEILYPRNL